MPFVAALRETELLTEKDDRVRMFKALTAKDKDDLRTAMRAEGIEVIPAS